MASRFTVFKVTGFGIRDENRGEARAFSGPRAFGTYPAAHTPFTTWYVADTHRMCEVVHESPYEERARDWARRENAYERKLDKEEEHALAASKERACPVTRSSSSSPATRELRAPSATSARASWSRCRRTSRPGVERSWPRRSKQRTGASCSAPCRSASSSSSTVPPATTAPVATPATSRSPLPKWREQNPDVDKCIRALFDALVVSGVIIDDRFIVRVEAEKRYGDPGVLVEVKELE